jgi:hypothetical protein
MAVSYLNAGGKTGGKGLVLCLSGDTKPAALAGWTLIETDTGNQFVVVTGEWSAASAGGSSNTGGVATITVANRRYEHSETVAAIGVTSASRVMIGLAPTLDSDENTAELLDLASCAATPGTDTITITATFLQPVAGPIKFNWSAS